MSHALSVLAIAQQSPYSKPSTIVVMVVTGLFLATILVTVGRDRRSPEIKQAQRTARETKSYVTRRVYQLPLKTELFNNLTGTIDLLAEAGEEDAQADLLTQLYVAEGAIEEANTKHLELLGRAEPEFDPSNHDLTYEEYDGIRVAYADLHDLVSKAELEILGLKSQNKALVRRHS